MLACLIAKAANAAASFTFSQTSCRKIEWPGDPLGVWEDGFVVGSHVAEPRPVDVSLVASLDLPAAVPLRSLLLEQLCCGSVSVDGSRVERVSTACVQVLAAAAAQAQRSNIPFAVRQASRTLREAVADLALTAALPLDP